MDKELKDTLLAIGRSPDTFQRDTPQLLLILENLEEFNRRVKNVGHEPERRIVDIGNRSKKL